MSEVSVVNLDPNMIPLDRRASSDIVVRKPANLEKLIIELKFTMRTIVKMIGGRAMSNNKKRFRVLMRTVRVNLQADRMKRSKHITQKEVISNAQNSLEPC